jgi:N6-L-threonylcarbamoyladenine synthase
VAWQDDDLVGFTGGMLIDGDMHILDLAVDPDRRRQGIASALLNRLLEDARSLGATTASLEVRASNNAAIALYNGIGFDTDGTRPGYYSPPNPGEAREDAYILRYRFAEEKNSVTANNRASDAVFSSESSLMTVQPAAVLPKPVILAIETSCDETAAAVITGNGDVLANIVASQVDYHARFGGVVPEIASRKHTEAIVGVIDAAMEMAELPDWSSLDAIAVTHTPGLIGALVVGVAFAKGLAWATNLPLVAVNHMEGHIYANRLAVVNTKAGQAARPVNEAICAFPAEGTSTEGGSVSSDTEAMTLPKVNSLFTMQPDPEPPFVVALLSGGHTMLVHVRDWANYEVLGQTLDDAVGEAFDKVAKALGLGYPGGPIISKLALEGDPKAIAFPRALMHSKDLSFSLSGLKTAVISWIREQTEAGNEISLPDVAASFQQAVIDVQVAKAAEACKQTNISTFCLGGGVAANQALREAYVNDLQKAGIKVYFPPLALCSDNAAMIAATALDRYARQVFMPLDGDATAQSDLSFDY